MKLIIMPKSISMLNNLLDKIDGVIVGYKGLCMNMPKDYSKEEFDQVMDCCLIDFCNEKDICEEGGINFSGGERQRIILARSIIKNSNIYIFDEALSQIDISKEKTILTNIFNMYKDKTIIVVSHRNNNKKLFDKCIEIKNGGFYEK